MTGRNVSSRRENRAVISSSKVVSSSTRSRACKMLTKTESEWIVSETVLEIKSLSHWFLLAKLERAMGFEPTTPTLAKLETGLSGVFLSWTDL